MEVYLKILGFLIHHLVLKILVFLILKNYVSVIWVYEKSPLLDDRLLINSVSVRWVFENMNFCKESLKNLSGLLFEIIYFSRYWKILPNGMWCNTSFLGNCITSAIKG